MRSKYKQGKKAKSPANAGESLLNRKILAPEKLKILVLAGNDLQAEHLDFLGKCNNLIKLDLSHNHIVRLPEQLDLGALPRLEVVFMHNNRLGSIDAMRPLFRCQPLTHLTYHHNPLQGPGRHEHQLVNALPSLKLINSRVVFIEERTDFLIPERPPVFADTDMLESWKSIENSQAYYLKVLGLQLQYIDNLWAFSNPIVIIQRAWVHFLPLQNPSPLPTSSLPPHPQSRPHSKQLHPKTSNLNQLASSQLQASGKPHPLREYFAEWSRFSTGLRAVRESMGRCKGRVDKGYMLLPLEDYNLELRNMRVNKPLVEYLKRIRQKIYERKMGKRLITNIRLKQTIFRNELSFYDISGIGQHRRFYYNRSQQHLLDNFMAVIAHQFDCQPAVSQASYRVATHLNAIRLVDPESFSNKYSGTPLHSICSLIWPSMKVVVSSRKPVASQFKAGIIGIPQLTYIKNRDKVVTETEMEKSRQVFSRLQKFAANEYENSLWCVQCEDEFVMRQLIRMAYYHNCKALKFQVRQRKNEMLALLQNFQEPFIFYVDNVIKRTCAAVTLQKSWRRYISNKSQTESIYRKMRKNRAALHIQRFFRDSVYRHRQHFSKKLAANLARLNTPTLLYPLSLYLNLHSIFPAQPRSSLYRHLRLTRSGYSLGISEEFYRPVFQRQIREEYFEGQLLGTENHSKQIDLYNLFHYQVSIGVVSCSGQSFISLTYSSPAKASMAAAITALLTYQLWSSSYVWPLSKDSPGQWSGRIDEYLRVKAVRPWVAEFRPSPYEMVSLVRQEYAENGLFLWPAQSKLKPEAAFLSERNVSVQFYQKRYHDFPVKQTQLLTYALLHEQPEPESKQFRQTPASTGQLPAKSLPVLDNPLSITMIDKRRLSLFDQSAPAIRPLQLELVTGMGKTQEVSENNKRDKVMRLYQEEYLKKQAQRDLKEGTLSGLRDKAKKERVLNSTLRSLKDAERTEALRNRVQRIRDSKQRSAPKRDEEEFVQQNNFVMQQQLKMVIMRGKMKEAEGRREELLAKKPSIDRGSSSIAVSTPAPLQKGPRERRRAEVEEAALRQAGTIGEEGEVVNARRRSRPRAQSIGAYLRDPSFVHGVFPEEYYPIDSRGTAFYFPPVV